MTLREKMEMQRLRNGVLELTVWLQAIKGFLPPGLNLTRSETERLITKYERNDEINTTYL